MYSGAPYHNYRVPHLRAQFFDGCPKKNIVGQLKKCRPGTEYSGRCVANIEKNECITMIRGNRKNEIIYPKTSF
jgi:hypothetical protein